MSDEDKRHTADDCVAKAKEANDAGDISKARRLLEKAIKLYPGHTEAKKLLQRLQSREQQETPVPPRQDGDGVRRRGHRESTDSTDSGIARGDYTAEQETLAKHVLKTRDYYEMLELKKDATEQDIKKGYRKMALKLHPDKNRAPSAEEAFKCISKAYECLSDQDKRRMYDQLGPEGMERRAATGHGMHPFAGGEVSPEDIFNAFFGGMGPGGMHGDPRFRTYHFSFGGNPFDQRRRRQAEADDNRPWFAPIVQFLPIILMFVFLFFPSGDSSSSDLFKMDRSNSYNVMRQSRDGIKYYVQPSFARYYGNNPQYMTEIEDKVLYDYSRILEQNCKQQTSEREDAIRRSNNVRNYEEAYGMPRTACDELNQLNQKSFRAS